jgi:hypothetical protein
LHLVGSQLLVRVLVLELIHLSAQGGLEVGSLGELRSRSCQMALLALNSASALEGGSLLVIKLSGIEGAGVSHELRT